MPATNALSITRLSLRDVLAAMTANCPSMNAKPGEVAAWFARGVSLLAPITRDLSHPDHDEAVVLAAKYSADSRGACVNGAVR